MLINVAKQCYDVDVYIFNNNIENTKIDSMIVDNDDKNLLEADYVEEETQVSIDMKIKEFVESKNIKCVMRRDYTPTTIQNSIRQMYSEEKVGDFLEKNKDKYKCAIVCGPDYFLLNQIKIMDIQKCINSPTIFTTNVNDGGLHYNRKIYPGYTNGFYIGTPNLLIKILKRYSILDKLLPTTADYEYLLKTVFNSNNMTREITNMRFFKVRSNKTVDRQGVMLHNNYTPHFNNLTEYINKL